MKEFKGTPGPWSAFDYEIFGGDGNHIIDMTYSCRTDVSVDKANTQLIAAAPELLEALQFTIHDVGHWLSTQKTELKEKIESAINKALGE